ncbi:MAG: rod shape-determining protein [Firmicutes bacterium]|nr:rod shape-determining protein [Bacillota bacterium]
MYKRNVDAVHLMMDVGTTHYRAATGKGQVIQEPCVVAHAKTKTPLIGTQAKRMIGRSPERVQIVHPVQEGVIVDLEATAAIMRSCIEQFSPRRFRSKVSLTIAVPSNLTHIQSRSLQEAGRLAGAQRIELVPASVAAGLGASLPMHTATGCLLVHLGGGVTEASVLSMGEVVESRRLPNGGQEMDRLIAERVRKEYFFLIGEQTAENMKRELSMQPELAGQNVRGRNLRTGLPGTVFVKRAIVDELLTAYAASVIDLIAQTISTCEPELAGDISERGIVLTGGLARIALLVSKIEQRVGVPTTVAKEPESCVIRGLIEKSAQLKSHNARTPMAALSEQVAQSVQQLFGKKTHTQSTQPED